MDIFEGYGLNLLHDHLKENAKLHPDHKREFIYLSRKQTVEDFLPVHIRESKSNLDRNDIAQHIESFYKQVSVSNPFFYYSKLKFVLEHIGDETIWSKEMLLRLISDRCLYFYDRRDFAKASKSCGLYGLVLNYRVNPNIEDLKRSIADGVEHVSSLHLEYLEENQSNYEKLKQAMQLKEQHLTISSTLLKEINRLGKQCKKANSLDVNPMIDENDSNNIPKKHSFTTIVNLIKIYVASVIWKTRKEDYVPLFEELFLAKNKESVAAFHNTVNQILNTLIKDGAYHPYSPIVLYHIITANTKALLQGKAADLWDNLTSNSKPARIDSMTSLTGRKAAINLALYQKLCEHFLVNKKLCVINEMPSAIKVQCFATTKKRVIMPVPEGCILESKDTDVSCPYGVKLEKTMNCIFALISGYGHLFHHDSMEPNSLISSTKLMISEADFAKNNFEVFSYRPDYGNPVDDFEHLINANINACFANRPEFFSLRVPKKYGRIGAASLSHLLLQDMVMPARQRISRFIQKSMNQEILEKYTPYVYFPYERSVVLSGLEDIIKTHLIGIENFLVRYHDFGTASFEYNYLDAIHTLVEYEIRHLLYEEGRQALFTIAKRVIPKYLYVGQRLLNKKSSGKSGIKYEYDPDFPDFVDSF